ncbi:MAG: hypothetical protein HKN23_22110 [Verrucomicrobiales bacterium]|nr:hypothetical protein [Verrucomicrobiales bacterium]
MTMHSEDPPSPATALIGTALSVAPAAVGCAVGLLLADRFKNKTRQTLAGTLFTVGALATLPLAIDYVTKTINSPSRLRGSTRRLEGIRQGGTNPEVDIIGGEEFFVDEV